MRCDAPDRLRSGASPNLDGGIPAADRDAITCNGDERFITPKSLLGVMAPLDLLDEDFPPIPGLALDPVQF
jgi:hypothetical protein